MYVCTVLYGTVRYSTIWCNIVVYSIMKSDTVWCNTDNSLSGNHILTQFTFFPKLTIHEKIDKTTRQIFTGTVPYLTSPHLTIYRTVQYRTYVLVILFSILLMTIFWTTHFDLTIVILIDIDLDTVHHQDLPDHRIIRAIISC